MMEMSTKGRYGARAMMDIAANGDTGPVKLRDVARRQEIPEKYLEQIVALLRKSGLLSSTRGARGGYRLTRAAREIRLSEVISAVEGEISTVNCVGSPKECSRSDLCAMREVWTRVRNAAWEQLEAVSIQDLVSRQEEMTEGAIWSYSI